MTRALAAGLLVLLFCGFAPAPFPRRAPQGDRKRLQGEWRLVRRGFAGQWHEDVPVTLVVNGGQATFRCDGEVLGAWKVRLNPSRSLKELDLEAVSVSYLPAGTVAPCVYRLETDELTIWESSTNGLRPKAIEPSAALTVSVYRRVKR
jgi:uncharacterized protein (TIGR03067 family)